MFRRLLKIAVLPAVLGICACSDDKTSGVFVEDNVITAGDVYSSSEMLSSSSIESSSHGVQSSSDQEVVEVCKNDLWDGAAGITKVKTESEITGYWYTWGDDGGASRIVFPVEMGNSYSDDALDAVVEHCGGFCGTIKFDYSDSSPAVGIGFLVAEEGKSTDISSWGGICVTYSSDVSFWLGIASEYSDASNVFSMVGIRFPSVVSGDTSLCARWENFSRNSPAVAPEDRRGDVDAKKAKAILFRFLGDGSESRDFNIKAVGTYDGDLPQVGLRSEDVQNGENEANEDSATCVWKGSAHWEYETQNGAGTWFVYADDNASKLYFPIDNGVNYSFWKYDPTLDYCGGFCGTMVLDRQDGGESFVGIGLAIAGYNMTSDVCDSDVCFFDGIKTKDIEDWGGICITYQSQKDAYLKLGIGSADEGLESMDFPNLHLPKSTTIIEKCYKWDEFDKLTSDQLKSVSVIAFETRSQTPPENVEFGVYAVGKYSAQGACRLKPYN